MSQCQKKMKENEFQKKNAVSRDNLAISGDASFRKRHSLFFLNFLGNFRRPACPATCIPIKVENSVEKKFPRLHILSLHSPGQKTSTSWLAHSPSTGNVFAARKKNGQPWPSRTWKCHAAVPKRQLVMMGEDNPSPVLLQTHYPKYEV